MEDDDEFGDLYTDVLRPLQSKQPSPNRPIDLNIYSDDDEILFPATTSNPNPNPKFNFATSHTNQAPVFKSENEGLDDGFSSLASDSSVSKVLDLNLMDESGIDVVVEESEEKDDAIIEKDEDLMDKKENFENFDIEEVDDSGIGDISSGLLIPGITGLSNGAGNGGDGMSGEGDDWDSDDSEDDLKIVLNENNHVGMVMDGNGVMGSDDEDEDGDPLVIVADSERVIREWKTKSGVKIRHRPWMVREKNWEVMQVK